MICFIQAPCPYGKFDSLSTFLFFLFFPDKNNKHRRMVENDTVTHIVILDVFYIRQKINGGEKIVLLILCAEYKKLVSSTRANEK